MGDPSWNCCKVWTHGWSIVGEDPRDRRAASWGAAVLPRPEGDEGWGVMPIARRGWLDHWLSGTASCKGPNPHRIVATCRRYGLMAFNRDVRWLWCGRQGEAWVGGWGLGGG